MAKAAYPCDVLAMTLHLKHHKMTLATEILEAFKAAGYTCEINGNQFGFRVKFRYYWFEISEFDGGLYFQQRYSQNTGKTNKGWNAAHDGYEIIEKVAGISFDELLSGKRKAKGSEKFEALKVAFKAYIDNVNDESVFTLEFMEKFTACDNYLNLVDLFEKADAGEDVHDVLAGYFM